MSGDFEELVRGSMEWFTGHVRLPAGLAGRARRHHRRRQRVVRAAIAAGTAAVVSAAGVIALTGGAGGAPGLHPRGGAGPAQAAAYVVQRTERAVSTKNLIMEISTPEQVITTEQPGKGPVRSFVPHSVWWAYRGRSRGEVYAAYLRRHGRPDAADTDTEYGPLGKSLPGNPSLHPFTQTTVNYSDRTWSRGTQLTGLASAPAGAAACELVKDMTDPLVAGEVFFTSPSFIRAALACGGLTKAGRTRVDGAAAIVLTGTQRMANLPITLYVSPATYLPVRIVIGGLRQDYRWLAPTAANLAMLKVRIPPGFRRAGN